MNNSIELPIIAAIDEIPPENIVTYIKEKIPEINTVKIGLEVFNLSGKNFLERFEKDHNIEYFLDLKLHDIPNTVYNAIKSLKGLSPKFLTIHLSGGYEMILKSLEARNKYLPNTKIIGVTYLTSLSEDNFFDLWGEQKESLLRKIVSIGVKASIDGIVCSANDIPIIKPLLHKQLIITPGIRPFGTQTGDQKRVNTPKNALEMGSDFLVVGRPLKDEISKKEILSQVREYYLSQ